MSDTMQPELAEGPHRRVLLATLASVAALGIGLAAASAASEPDFFSDFRTNVWQPGRALLAGDSPFRSEDSTGSVYPPAAALMTLPFALPPYRVAAGIWVVTLLAALIAALALCGVRDVRCFALALASPAVVTGLAFANVSLLLVLALAAIWIWRDRPARVGLVLGAVIAAKLFLVPLVAWLFLTGRRAAALVSLAAATVFSIVGWLVVGLAHAGDFPELSRANVRRFAGEADSLVSLLVNAGAAVPTATLLATLAGAIVLVLAARSRGDEIACLGWTIAAVLLASPIVWTHYFALVLVPLALSRPRLSPAWLLPYLALPQMTPATSALERVVDPASGVVLALGVGRVSGGSSERIDVSASDGQRAEVRAIAGAKQRT